MNRNKRQTNKMGDMEKEDSLRYIITVTTGNNGSIRDNQGENSFCTSTWLIIYKNGIKRTIYNHNCKVFLFCFSTKEILLLNLTIASHAWNNDK